MSGFGNIQPRTGNKDSVRLEEVIKMHKWPADEWSQVRFVPGKILPVKRHWISIIAGKDKKEITIPRYCLAFDNNNENAPRQMPNPNYKKGSSKKAEQEKMIPIPCPYCTLAHGQDASARYEFFYLANAIIREVQEDMPARAKKIERTKDEKKTGFKDIRSKSWTPVEVCRITSTVANRIKELGDGNFVKNKKKPGEKQAFDVTHEKYGIDIRVKYKPKAAGTEKYSADKEDRTPLTDDEKGYLIWRLDDSLIDVTGRMELPQALEDFKRMEVVGADEVDDDSEGYSLGDDDGKKKKKGDKKGKKKGAFDDDDDEPKSKKKAKKSKSDDDDDEDDDEPKKSKGKKKAAFDDDDDEDEDDAPKKKKKSSDDKKSSKSKDKVKAKKSKSDDDEPKKKKKKAKDEDDEPKKKKKSSDDGKKSKSKDKKADKAGSKKGKKKSAWDDDDE